MSLSTLKIENKDILHCHSYSSVDKKGHWLQTIFSVLFSTETLSVQRLGVDNKGG